MAFPGVPLRGEDGQCQGTPSDEPLLATTKRTSKSNDWLRCPVLHYTVCCLFTPWDPTLRPPPKSSIKSISKATSRDYKKHRNTDLGLGCESPGSGSITHSATLEKVM